MTELPYPPILGIYRGVVVSNQDPERLGRLQIIVPAILGGTLLTPWAAPCSPAGARGGLPLPGATVWVAFEGGDIQKPIWLGIWPLPSTIFQATLGATLGLQALNPTIT